MTKSELIALLAADPAVIGNHLTARDVDYDCRVSTRQPD